MAIIKHANAATIARDAVVLDLGDLRRQGEQLMEQAKRRAEQIVRDAEAERDRLVRGAAERGHAEGLAKGLEEGRGQGRQLGRDESVAAAAQSLDALQRRWAAALEEFLARREQMLQEARRDVLRLAMLVAEKVTKRKVEVDAAVAAAQVEAVLALIARPTELVIAIHPEDRPELERALPSLLQRFACCRHAELADDPSLSRGSCVVRTRDRGEPGAGDGSGGGGGGGEIDASIGTQLARIAEALLPSSAGDAAGDPDELSP